LLRGTQGDAALCPGLVSLALSAHNQCDNVKRKCSSGDGGLMLLRQADRRLGLTRALDAALPDPRHPVFIVHRQIDLLRQRIYGLAAGYEDLNDHDTLRGDLLWQSAMDRKSELWPAAPRSAVWKTAQTARRHGRFTKSSCSNSSPSTRTRATW